MNCDEFRQAKNFIFTDIQREISLAHASENQSHKIALENIGIPAGGGNFLAALGLLNYTEFGGKLKYYKKKKNGSDYASENFNLFFDDLGAEYKKFRTEGNNVYSIFRCGLVHEYYVKNNCTIFICSKEKPIGIGHDEDGKYWFVVETYFGDLKRSLEDLERSLYPEEFTK